MQAAALTHPTPFWHRLNAFFAFPFQSQPLVYGMVLAMCSLLVELMFFLPEPLDLVLVEGGIVLAASRYAFKIVALGSRGVMRARDFPSHLDEDWVGLPWKLFAVVVLQGLAVGWLGRLSPVLGSMGLFVISFVFPASVMVLVQTCSIFQTLNLGLVWDTVRTVGWPYVVLCVFLFLLSSGAQIALTLLLPVIGGWVVLPVFNFAFIYFAWVMASLLGYVMYQHHAAFGVSLLPGGGMDDVKPDRRTPAQVAQHQVDALIAQMVTDGDVDGALGLAYEEQRHRQDDLAAQRRYHQVLLLAGKTTPLLDHAQRYIALLILHQQPAEALKVYRACHENGGGFVIEDAAVVLALAGAQWRNGEARAALALLSGFDKRFRGHAAIPQAYELAARVLVQGLNRVDMARPILATLEARYPDSGPTQEVRWLLRSLPVVGAEGARSQGAV
ncbi:MAG: hypothetical protein Q8R67_03065 [Rhodoferax sp.]|nr:hypothetical protein [Rhodoferax sp.]MDP3650643.1 hypothetical protein [Rhodoferax sp.]